MVSRALAESGSLLTFVGAPGEVLSAFVGALAASTDTSCGEADKSGAGVLFGAAAFPGVGALSATGVGAVGV